MNKRIAWKQAGHVLAFILISTWAMTAHAELGSCTYRLQSTRLHQSYLVCQTADSAAQCGTWGSGAEPNSRYTAFAEGKDAGKVVFETKGCDARQAVGMCLLSRGRIYFYEGTPKQLANGCARMRGEYFETPPERKATLDYQR